ncbi:MAG: hypothetical protein ACJZ9G_08305 [Rhodospirillales bacterium]
MKSVTGVILISACVVSVAAIVLLLTWEIEPPTNSTEEIIPNSRFLK